MCEFIVFLLQLDIAALDQRTREALTDVKFFSRRLWSAVEEREKKLFKQIVETRRWKYEVLHEKYMNLKEDKTRLSQAINALKCAIHDAQSSSACNPDDLLQRKDMVLAEVFQIRLTFILRIFEYLTKGSALKGRMQTYNIVAAKKLFIFLIPSFHRWN